MIEIAKRKPGRIIDGRHWLAKLVRMRHVTVPVCKRHGTICFMHHCPPLRGQKIPCAAYHVVILDGLAMSRARDTFAVAMARSAVLAVIVLSLDLPEPS